jgi:hypothetical protein
MKTIENHVSETTDKYFGMMCNEFIINSFIVILHAFINKSFNSILM